MNSIVRIAAAVNHVALLDSSRCLERLWQQVSELSEKQPDIILLPPLSLSGVGCGSFFASRSILEDCQVALEELCVLSSQLSCYLVVGLPADDAGRAVSAMAVIYSGKLLGLVPSLDPPKGLVVSDYSDKLLPVDTVFGCGSLRFCVLPCNVSSLSRQLPRLEGTGCDLVLVPSAEPAVAGSMKIHT